MKENCSLHFSSAGSCMTLQSAEAAVERMRLRHAMVCASNQNRSMEAHSLLQKQGLDVSSYGTGAHVKLPGPSIREPNVYTFGTPYRLMFDDLKRKDPELYPSKYCGLIDVFCHCGKLL